MRRAAKVDRNQAEIVKALRKVGATVQSLAMVGNGCPDVLVGFRRSLSVMEIKDGLLVPSARKLTPKEEEWHRTWQGFPVFIVKDIDDALRAIGAVTP